jgi:hypothetical protein
MLIVTLGLLRPIKGLTIALQYDHKAEERRPAPVDKPPPASRQKNSVAGNSTRRYWAFGSGTGFFDSVSR